MCNMKKAIEKYLGQDKLIGEIGGDAAFSLYRWGTALHRYRKNMTTIKEAADLNEPPVAAKPNALGELVKQMQTGDPYASSSRKPRHQESTSFWVRALSPFSGLLRYGNKGPAPKK